MIVRELVTKLGFKTDESSLNKFEEGVNSAKNSVLALTAAITSAVTAMLLFVESSAKAGDRLDKLKDIIGVTTKDYQLLEGAANLAGIENEEFSKSLQLFARSIGMARQGMSQYIKEFAILGINMRNGNGKLKDNKELLLEVADAFQNKLKNNVDRAAVAQLLFGRSGLRMINFLKQGRKGISEMTSEVGKYAFLMDEKAIKQSVKFKDTQFLLKLAFAGIKNEIGQGLMPVFQKIIDETLKWLAANRQLIVSGITKFFKVMLVLARELGKAFKFLMSVIKNIVVTWDHLNKAFGVTFKILTELFAAGLLIKIIRLKEIVLSFFAVFNIVAPEVWAIGAAIGALILVLDDLAVYMTGGKSIIGMVLKKFPNFKWMIEYAIFQIKTITNTIMIGAKIVGGVLIGLKTAINFAVIMPLKFIVRLVNDVVSSFNKLFGMAGTIIGYISKGLSAIGITHNVVNKSSPGLDFAKSPVGMTPAMSSMGGLGDRNLNFSTNIQMSIPDGTPAAQQAFLSDAAERTFDPIFKRRLREAMMLFPGVEQ